MSRLVAAELPRVAACTHCEHEVRIRKDGTLHGHPDHRTGLCPGSGTTAGPPLEPTFTRWLYAHRRRRDAYTNVLTDLAQYLFGNPRGCGGHRLPTDMPWTTAAELHTWLHEAAPYADARRNGCDWVCRQTQDASGAYAQLTGDTP